jgi:hypothetical protein
MCSGRCETARTIIIFEQSARERSRMRSCGWSRQSMKIEQLPGPRFAGVVTIIPDENGSEDEPVIMWRGVTGLCTAYPDAFPGPPARPTDALGVSPHGITSNPRFSLLYPSG